MAARYAHILEHSHIKFLESFNALPLAAQCLYARMAGRKGCIFDVKTFTYPEIKNIPKQVKTLLSEGFAGPIVSADYQAYLTQLTKANLVAFLSAQTNPKNYKTSWTKAALVDAAVTQIPFQKHLIEPYYIKQSKQAELRYFLYLYFGKITDNMQSFTLRDLGLIKTPDFKDDYDARFETKEQARAAYYYANALTTLKFANTSSIQNIIDAHNAWPTPECEISELARDEFTFKAGQHLERCGQKDKALKIYTTSQSAECAERVIRLRYSEGDKIWTKQRLEEIIDNPNSDTAYYFATDFYNRKFNKEHKSNVTKILQSGELIYIDELYKNMPENAAKMHYTNHNYESYFTENITWRMLFGLIFWEELFCAPTSKIHNSFEKTPAELKGNTFYKTHKTAIETKLNIANNKDIFFRNLLKIFTQYYGIPNSIFRWKKRELDKIKSLIYTSPPESLMSFLRLMAKDYSNMKDGFPDLMLIRNNAIRFIEVKSEGDVIRRNQLTRIQQLRSVGFECDITRIKWRVDPEQVYVVVDIETTGGQKGNHRITEIGAVKIQGGKIIDEWQSLINPHRHIPKFIQTLTGITNEMVANAPSFSDISKQFSDFMGDNIFAAHNVNFDYGFISREYQRIDQKFRAPKICTCASMRKYYPGYKSYSLKNLCREFDIDLTSHHRALCDAKAAAELLIRINEKRIAAQENGKNN